MAKRVADDFWDAIEILLPIAIWIGIFALFFFAFYGFYCLILS